MSSTKHTSWQLSTVALGIPEWIPDQPYQIDLPAYNFGKTYRTHSGDEKIDISELVNGMPDPSLLKNLQSIDVRASTTIDGKNYKETITIADQAGLQAFHNAALASLGIDMISTGKPRLQPRAEASAQWVEGDLRAGETAKLKVTVKNTGKGELYRVTATVSSNRVFNDRTLKFGKIDPGKSKTLELSFKTDELMRTQDIPIHLHFAEYNDYKPPDIPAKLHVIENPRPRFDYAYRILDGGTLNSVGNGDGIIQPGESADIVLNVRNSGAGTVEPGESNPSETSMTIKETIPLSYGENQIKLIAFDTDNQSSEPIVIHATRTREIGELWVIAIGVSDYQRIPDLIYADDDAKAVADYFRSIGVPDDHITLLRDGRATAGEIRRAFGELMGKAKKSATVIIHFSGHGAPTPNPESPDGDGIDKYLLTYDADASNFYGTAFPMDEVAGIFKRLASDRVIFLADTCYSGATGGKIVLAKSMTDGKFTVVPNYDRFWNRLTEGKGRVILTASRGDEIAQESPKFRHGVFTYFVLEALRGAADRNGDGFITLAEVYDHVSHEVPKHANQHPMWKGEASGDIVIGRVK